MISPWTDKPFILSIETDAGTYRHPFHLGTDERIARSLAENICKNQKPEIGKYIVTVGLMYENRLFDCFDGHNWASEY